jgi:hypothetical protein
MKKIIASLFLMAACQVGFAGGFVGEGLFPNDYNRGDINGYWYCEYYSSGNQCYIVGNVSGSIPSTATILYIPFAVFNEEDFTTRTVTQLGNGSTIIYDQQVYFSLSIPSVQSINSYAFSSLQNLTTVVINGSPDIQSNAFSNDPNLTDVSPPLSGDIGDSAFEGCVKLRNIGLKEGVTKIGKRAFANCKSLRTLTIPKTVVSIAPDAFAGSGIKSVVLERGNAPLKFSKGIYVTVKQQPYPKR